MLHLLWSLVLSRRGPSKMAIHHLKQYSRWSSNWYQKLCSLGTAALVSPHHPSHATSCRRLTSQSCMWQHSCNSHPLPCQEDHPLHESACSAIQGSKCCQICPPPPSFFLRNMWFINALLKFWIISILINICSLVTIQSGDTKMLRWKKTLSMLDLAINRKNSSTFLMSSSLTVLTTVLTAWSTKPATSKRPESTVLSAKWTEMWQPSIFTKSPPKKKQRVGNLWGAQETEGNGLVGICVQNENRIGATAETLTLL